MRPIDADAVCEWCRKSGAICTGSDCEIQTMPTLTPPNETPPCYQPDGDGCAYQCYDGQDEPIDKCKECPLCYSDKQRQHTPPNELLPVLVNDEPDQEYIDYICPRCKDTISQRRRGQRMETVYQCKYHDNCGQRVDWSNPQPYRRPTEGEA